MLKWKFDRSSKDESKEKLLVAAASDSSSVSSSDLAPSQLRINKILQAYEDYRTKLLSDLDNVSIKSSSTHREDTAVKEKTTAAGSKKQALSTDVSDSTETINLLLTTEPVVKEETTSCFSLKEDATSALHVGEDTTPYLPREQKACISSKSELPEQPTTQASQEEVKVRKEATDGLECCQMPAKVEPSMAAAVEVSTLESAIPELTKAIQAISEKTEKSAELGNVLDMITSLKSEFESIKVKLDTSAESQHKLQQEVGNLKVERTTLLKSLMGKESSVSQSSGSALDVNTATHYQSKFSLPESSTSTSCAPPKEKRASANPLMSSFIANLPSPKVGKEKQLGSYTDSEISWTSSMTKDHYSAPYTGQTGPPVRRQQKTSGTEAKNRHSLTSIQIQSMFDLRADAGHDKRKQLTTFQQAQRLRLLRELSEGERRYCTDLWQLTQNYGRLLHSTGAVPHRDALKLFPAHLTEMYIQHCMLLQSVNKKILQWKHSSCCYGNLLSTITSNRKVDMLGMYKDYIDRFPASVRILNKLSRQSQLFRRVLRRSKHQGGAVGNAEDLILLLVRPIRMIPSYLVFLKEVLYHTESDHPDRFHLQSSAETLWRFLKSNDTFINSCLQMAGVYTQPPPKQYMLNQSRSQAKASQRLHAEKLSTLRETPTDSGIESHSESTRSHLPTRARQGSASQRADTHPQIYPDVETDYSSSHYNFLSDQAMQTDVAIGGGRSLQRYNSLRTVHQREFDLYENIGGRQDKSRGKSVTLQAGQQLSHNKASNAARRGDSKTADTRQSDLVRRLGHCSSHGVGPHSGSSEYSQKNKVRFRTPVAESASIRRAPSQMFANGKKAITDTFKGMFSKRW